uniref:Glycine-rich RNA-binding protein 4, mitochondrial isoform X2 n=2 Tax=Elaeis guineensis var. tenera TaxID=51953 RepID=A0A6J0PER1_ELAGV|nr:glycine-rich RNA-binding protein 4, mitochondrial isoform X2 [Elaeis guineensis]
MICLLAFNLGQCADRRTMEMAFCGKVSSLIRQSVLKISVPSGPLPSTHMLSAIRSFTSTRLFIGGLSFGIDDQTLKEAFSSFGNVTEARVILDRDTGRSRGFGFVNFESDEDASAAMSSMDGRELNGRTIRISYANSDRQPARFGDYSGRSNRGFQGNGDS